VIVVAVRWYLRYGLSYRDVEKLLAEHGVQADHVTAYRWVQRFTPLLADAARFARRSPGDRWFVDETYVKVAGVWRYVYRAIDQHGQVIDVLVCPPRRGRGPKVLHPRPQGVEDGAGRGGDRRRSGLPGGARRPGPAAWHHVEQYANNPVEADHSRLKYRLRPMRGLRTDRTAQTVIAGHAFRPEPAPRTLRDRHRHDTPATPGRRAHRTRHGDLTPAARPDRTRRPIE
jgi:IS6 family transposase